MTRFEQFQQNVQQWATERGIYEHSTPLAQALKAVSEVGELCDAVIKNDRDALIDAIGDVAVCLVNWARMRKVAIDPADYSHGPTFGANQGAQQLAADIAYAVGKIASYDRIKPAQGSLAVAISGLFLLARNSGLDFDDCCGAAWNEIKDRKGRMVAGGAFVKEGE